MIAWSLVSISVFCGAAIACVFRRVTNGAALRSVRRRLQAHLLEIRLFFDEPRLAWRAQGAIIVDNARLIALLLPALVLVGLPMMWLLPKLDGVYGWAPLAVGEPAVVTAQMASTLGRTDAASSLAPASSILVETPPVRSFVDRQISWRVRPLRAGGSNLRISLPGESFELPVAAGAEGSAFVHRRESSPAPNVTWIEVDYPRADVRLAGIGLPWLAWFLIISTLSAWLCARSLSRS